MNWKDSTIPNCKDFRWQINKTISPHFFDSWFFTVLLTISPLFVHTRLGIDFHFVIISPFLDFAVPKSTLHLSLSFLLFRSLITYSTPLNWITIFLLKWYGGYYYNKWNFDHLEPSTHSLTILVAQMGTKLVLFPLLQSHKPQNISAFEDV